ncbi:MAG: response regulator [Nitrospirae bacterium]|nr:response regulator [Nitrospirota bacterium]
MEKKALKGMNLVNNPIIYSLSLAIYCTGWTFYGSVGSAANTGLLFTTVYLGPTVSIMLYWILLRKLVVLKNNYRITSIADFISNRYGKSQTIAALVSLFLFIGIAPYIALQLKAISSTMDIVTNVSPVLIESKTNVTNKENTTGPEILPAIRNNGYAPKGGLKDNGIDNDRDATDSHKHAVNAHDWILVILLILFTILFGVRRLDPTERHQGIVIVVAIESIVKIIAFVSVGIFVTFYLYNGFGDIFVRFHALALSDPTKAIQVPGHYKWMTYFVLSMSAILFLPRQFHVSVIENFKSRHILTAMWLFPLYMFLINIFAYPIALGGLIHGIPKSLADNFVLLFPKLHDMPWLTMFVFIGGVSASTSMVIVSSMALSTMVTNHIILPFIVRTKRLTVLKRHLLYFRWLVVALSILTGYYLSVLLSDKYIFIAIGMLSFAAVFQLVPSIVGGLFWSGGNRMGALLGLCCGYLLWFYTLLFPALVKSKLIPGYILDNGLFGLNYLKPEQLFGLTSLDPLTNGVFWSMLFNVLLYIGGSAYFKQTEEEKNTADNFVKALETHAYSFISLKQDYTIELSVKINVIRLMFSEYFGRQKTNDIVQNCIKELKLENKTRISLMELIELSNMVEKLLSGSIGASSANYIIQHSRILTGEEKKQISNIYGNIISELKLSPSELRKKIDYHKEKETILARHTEELENKVQKRTTELSTSLEILAEKDIELTATLDYVNAVIDNMADGLLVVNGKHVITRVNEPLARLFNVNGPWCVGKPVEEIFGPDMSSLLQQCADKRDKGAISTDINLSSRKVLMASAAVIHVADKCGRHARSQNRVESAPVRRNGIVVIVRDITREKELDKMKTDFISTVSHELRTPLTSVLGFAEIIADRLEEQIFPNLITNSPKAEKSVKVVRDNMNIILQEGIRLTALINDVLDIAKMEAGKVDWKREDVSVAEVIDRALLSTKSLYSKKDLELISDVESGLPIVSGDHDRLLQVMINLISNAIKFTDSGTITCTAKMGKSTDNKNEIVVSVIDTGMGIDVENHDKVFEKFRQIGDTLTGKPRGTGLGLPICMQIIQHHGGRIWVESKPGEGSNFSFALPVSGPAGGLNSTEISATDMETLVSRINQRVSTIESHPKGETKNILVVDDDENIRKLLVQEIERNGYNVTTARDGIEALESIRKDRPNLIILDVMMPGMSGFDVAAVLKGDPVTSDIPVIILSIIEDRNRGRRLGIDRYLTKPIDMNVLFKEIKELLIQGGTKKKILVVDKNESNIKTLADVLQTMGFTVVSASDGLDSIEKVRAEKPDMIIVDAMLSQRDELVKTLRFEKGLENVYFIYLYGQERIDSGTCPE